MISAVCLCIQNGVGDESDPFKVISFAEAFTKCRLPLQISDNLIRLPVSLFLAFTLPERKDDSESAANPLSTFEEDTLFEFIVLLPRQALEGSVSKQELVSFFTFILLLSLSCTNTEDNNLSFVRVSQTPSFSPIGSFV